MFDRVPNVTVADWFASAEITSRMLRTLLRIGPGGVLIANPYRRDYYVTHSRTLDFTDQLFFIVYGYHDLIHDLSVYTDEYADRAWEELVPAVDCTVWECLDQKIENISATGFVVTRMRRHMQRLGFDLTSAPNYYDRGDHAGSTTRMVCDHYADRARPSITITVKSPADEKTGGLSLITISDGDCHITGWPKALRQQFIAGANARRAREAVDTYLSRTRT